MKTNACDAGANESLHERVNHSRNSLHKLSSSIHYVVKRMSVNESSSLELKRTESVPYDMTPLSLEFENLLPHEQSAFDNVKQNWLEISNKRVSGSSSWYMIPDTSLWVKESDFSDEMILRSVMCTNFDTEAAQKALKRMNKRYLALTSFSLEEQLMTKTLFVLPGLKDKNGQKVFYMRPARFYPEVMSVDNVIDNLAYCMQCMLEDGKCCRDGITLLANMSGWTKVNFSVNYCRRFMYTLQGRDMPVNVKSFLIVDPPNWFGSIWRIMKTVLSPAFQRKVHMISSDDLHMYFEEGFTSLLPDEMDMGRYPTDSIVSDFVEFRKKIEGGDEGEIQTEIICL